MDNIEFSEPKKLPIADRIVKQMSLATIRSFPDAIVELVTNADDSYGRLEDEGIKCSGEINIFIKRLKYGICKELSVTDAAEGMDKDKLEDALEFGGETSGIEKGKSVRGLFGRGLKETIIALGIGTVYTIKEDKMAVAKLWWDENAREADYQISKESCTPSREERGELGIEKNGTCTKISVTNKEIRCPDQKTLKPQICNHFALRDINSSTKRKVRLCFESPEKAGLKTYSEILYELPKGNIAINKVIKLPNYEDEITIKIYESENELDSPYNDPYSKAGLLIKSGGAILDKKLFRFELRKSGVLFLWRSYMQRNL